MYGETFDTQPGPLKFIQYYYGQSWQYIFCSHDLWTKYSLLVSACNVPQEADDFMKKWKPLPNSLSFNDPIGLLFINGNGTYEDAYASCNKYIPLVVSDGIVIINDTRDASATVRFLEENEDNITG